MTFVGKVLVVVQVVLSICFMSFAAAVFTIQGSWKATAEDFEAQINDPETGFQKQIKDLQEEFNDYKKNATIQVKTEKDRADRFEADNAGKTQLLVLQKKLLDTAVTERNEAIALSEIAGAEARARKMERDTEIKNNNQLHKILDLKVAMIRDLEDDVFNKDRSAKSLIKKHSRILEEYAMLKDIVRKNDLSTDPKDYADKVAPPPKVEAFVLNTQKAKRDGTFFVEISIGSDDGLLKGHNLFVYRLKDRGKYLGKIQVVYVTPDRAVGRVVQKAKNGVIEVGDNVTTKL